MKQQEVIMYTVPLWPHCVRAKRFLSGKGIKFTERNIIFPKYRKEMKEVTDALTVPITCVGERVLIGFSSGEYEEVLKDY